MFLVFLISVDYGVTSDSTSTAHLHFSVRGVRGDPLAVVTRRTVGLEVAHGTWTGEGLKFLWILVGISARTDERYN